MCTHPFLNNIKNIHDISSVIFCNNHKQNYYVIIILLNFLPQFLIHLPKFLSSGNSARFQIVIAESERSYQDLEIIVFRP